MYLREHHLWKGAGERMIKNAVYKKTGNNKGISQKELSKAAAAEVDGRWSSRYQ